MDEWNKLGNSLIAWEIPIVTSFTQILMTDEALKDCGFQLMLCVSDGILLHFDGKNNYHNKLKH